MYILDGLGHATPSATYLEPSQASCVIVSGFRAALDLDIYPLSNLIRSRFAERAKPGQGKTVLFMHIGFVMAPLTDLCVRPPPVQTSLASVMAVPTPSQWGLPLNTCLESLNLWQGYYCHCT